jgi:chromosome partitioning protein
LGETILNKTIAFHSYKGGTGKTTLISNVAARFAYEGYKVGLLDMDIYAPSLVTYFRKKPSSFLNDLLSNQADISDIVSDLGPELGLKGALFVGFSSNRKEDINEIELKHDQKWQLEALKRFLAAKSKLFKDHKLDYLFLDTSPGIRYWSVNSLAAADLLLLMMKDSDMDIEGTRKMTNDIYDSLTRFGARYYVVLNKVPSEGLLAQYSGIKEEQEWISELERVVGAQVVGSIPCYCDIQFSRHEYLFSIRNPDHPFAKKIASLVEKIKSLN